MSLTITLGGVDRTNKVQLNTFALTNALGQRDTCVFSCKGDSSYAPELGQTVTVEHSELGALFGGKIDRVSTTLRGAENLTSVACASWEQICDRRRVGGGATVTFVDQPAGDVFQSIFDDYLGAENLTATIVEAGPNITIAFDWCSVREAFDAICAMASDDTDTFMWGITPGKVTRFYSQASYAAPIDVDESEPEVFRDIAVTRTFDGYINKVFVRLGKYITEERTNTYTGDGSLDSFTFEIPLARVPSVTVDTGSGPVAQTVGIRDVDTGKDCYWQDGSTEITFDTAPASGADIEIVAQGYQSTVVDAGQNDDEVAERSTIEDNSGWYMGLIEVDEAGTSADAIAKGQAYLARYARLPYAVDYRTGYGGIKAGMYQTISLTKFGPDFSGTFIIQSSTLVNEGGQWFWRVSAVNGAIANGWLQKLRKIATGQSGGGTVGGTVVTPGGGSGATAPDDFVISSVAYDWRTQRIDGRVGLIHMDPSLRLSIKVTPPSPLGECKGGHVWLEIPDQSTATAMRMDGTTPMDGTAVMAGQWSPIDAGKFPYVDVEQPWILELPPSVSIRAATDIRVYVASYSDQVDNPLVRAGETGATPSTVVTVQPYSAPKPQSGSNVTELLVPSISASVGDAVSVAGKLRRPISVEVDLTGLTTPLPDNWAYQLVGYVNGDITGNPVLSSGYFSHEGLVEAGPDGIETPHTFGPEEPTTSTSITIYAVAGLLIQRRPGQDQTARQDFKRNNIVPGITASASVTIGTTTGVIDPTEQMQAKLAATVEVLNGLFGVAELGISEGYLASLAVSTAKIQSAAVSLAKMATLSVDTAQLVDLSVATQKINNLAVGTAKLDSAAVTTAKIGNLQVTTALIANQAVGTSQIANLAVGTAQIADLAVTNAKIASLDVTKLNAGTISAAISMTAPTLVITSGTVTVNIDASNYVKLTDSGVLSSFVQLNPSYCRVQKIADSFNYGQLGLATLALSTPSGANTLTLTPTLFKMTGLLSSNPGAGSKELWYDPADGNRVKYAP